MGTAGRPMAIRSSSIRGARCCSIWASAWVCPAWTSIWSGFPRCARAFRRLRIGGLTLRVVKPCTRCVITTQDVESGESTGPEPLRTLKAMGRVWQKMPVFGQNAIPDGPGAIAVGDAVEVL